MLRVVRCLPSESDLSIHTSIGSINYFVRHGWRPGEPVTVRAGAAGASHQRYKDVPHEYSLQSLRPGHGRATFDQRFLLPLIGRFGFVALTAFGQRYQSTMLAVRGKNAMETGEVDSGLGHSITPTGCACATTSFPVRFCAVGRGARRLGCDPAQGDWSASTMKGCSHLSVIKDTPPKTSVVRQ